jgi:WD40 repeat protein
MRGSYLELEACRAGLQQFAAEAAAEVPDRPWRTRWARWQPLADQQVLRGHDGWVMAVAVGALPDGTPVIVSGGSDGTVRIWRLADGSPVGEPLRGHDDEVRAVAVGGLPTGTPVIVSGGSDGTVRIWRLADGSPVGEPLELGASVGSVSYRHHEAAVGSRAGVLTLQPAYH